MNIKVPISVGELFDKVSILENKLKNITDKDKLKNIEKEHKLLSKIALKIDVNYWHNPNYKKLYKVNTQLWDIEEGKRDHERRKDFGQSFVDLARQVYIKNDLRAKHKRALNMEFGSEIIEEKSYKKY